MFTYNFICIIHQYSFKTMIIKAILLILNKLLKTYFFKAYLTIYFLFELNR